jgi:hypothetical protein
MGFHIVFSTNYGGVPPHSLYSSSFIKSARYLAGRLFSLTKYFFLTSLPTVLPFYTFDPVEEDVIIDVHLT